MNFLIKHFVISFFILSSFGSVGVFLGDHFFEKYYLEPRGYEFCAIKKLEFDYFSYTQSYSPSGRTRSLMGTLGTLDRIWCKDVQTGNSASFDPFIPSNILFDKRIISIYTFAARSVLALPALFILVYGLVKSQKVKNIFFK
jgi:hypothetical protein